MERGGGQQVFTPATVSPRRMRQRPRPSQAFPKAESIAIARLNQSMADDTNAPRLTQAKIFSERFSSGARTAPRTQTIALRRINNEFRGNKYESSPGRDPKPDVTGCRHRRALSAGKPRQTALPQISFSCGKVPALAVRINSIPCVRQIPVHLLVVVRQLAHVRARRFTVGNQD